MIKAVKRCKHVLGNCLLYAMFTLPFYLVRLLRSGWILQLYRDGLSLLSHLPLPLAEFKSGIVFYIYIFCLSLSSLTSVASNSCLIALSLLSILLPFVASVSLLLVNFVLLALPFYSPASWICLHCMSPHFSYSITELCHLLMT